MVPSWFVIPSVCSWFYGCIRGYFGIFAAHRYTFYSVGKPVVRPVYSWFRRYDCGSVGISVVLCVHLFSVGIFVFPSVYSFAVGIFVYVFVVRESVCFVRGACAVAQRRVGNR